MASLKAIFAAADSYCLMDPHCCHFLGRLGSLEITTDTNKVTKLEYSTTPRELMYSNPEGLEYAKKLFGKNFSK